jgi:outer membrane immunogenic protein
VTAFTPYRELKSIRAMLLPLEEGLVNKLVVAVAGLAALIGTPALAADLPMAAPVYKAAPPVPFSWSGFYIGVNAGYGWASSNWTFIDSFPPAPFSSAKINSAGLLGGVEAGADHQFGNWVLGIGADFSLINSDATSSTSTVLGTAVAAHSEIDWLATFTGRFGYALDRSLLYLKGGVAGAEFKDDILLTAGAAALDSAVQDNTRIGWTIGAGYEYAILDNWTARIEYDYLDFARKNEVFSFSSGTGIAIDHSIDRKIQLLKLGVDYKFQ